MIHNCSITTSMYHNSYQHLIDPISELLKIHAYSSVSDHVMKQANLKDYKIVEARN